MDSLQKKSDIKSLMANDAVKAKFAEILGKNANAFITSVVTLATTTALAECESKSILNCAIMSATLNLQISPTLGFACILPYNSKNGKVAQFQIMSKGLVQLALRSNQFETINVIEVKEGEIKSHNLLSGKIEFEIKENRENLKTIGYASYFKLLNGFESTLYMTIAEINAHGKKFSKTFSNQFGAWQTNFEGMAKKTVLKLNLSRYAPMSVEMIQAVEADQSIIKTDDNLDFSEFQYIDNEEEKLSSETKEDLKPKLDLK